MISYKLTNVSDVSHYNRLQGRLHLMPARAENSGVGNSNYGV